MKEDKTFHQQIRGKVVEETFVKPAYSLIGLMVGLPLMLVPWAIGIPSLAAILTGLGLSATSVGAYLTWVAMLLTPENREEMAQRILADVRHKAKEKKKAELRQLREDLTQDKDSRTERLLDTLVELVEMIRENGGQEGPAYMEELDTLSGMDELFETCIKHLKKSYAIYLQRKRIPRGMKDLKKTLQDRREELIEEVDESVQALGEILVTSSELTQDDDGAGRRIRKQLSKQLEVARRVDERIRSWDNPKESAAEERKHRRERVRQMREEGSPVEE